ncbi:hypothetical protein NSE01_36790 [Novosphingobium sediminis]|uniref:Zorya protein ZorC EH domain-containing protein n=1 Tax=Novosphingobium sediminis TaxID=707214 RepID=A0A512AQJ9_9SPHN|nr:EH signature domain-containing protein [Novosphingobium sediminis]GEO01847.1 hypothetical protein NSE01_36790 [Novosphingobium sediminis]
MDPSQLSRRDLRRLVQDMWGDPRCNAIAASALTAASASGAKSIERTLISAYLRYFPVEHPVFPALAEAVSGFAEQHDWPWRERGRNWRLWDPQNGPTALAEALIRSNDPTTALRDAGLDGDLAQGEFALVAVAAACRVVAEMRGAEAQSAGRKIISLSAAFPTAQLDGLVLKALLAPWRSQKPPKPYLDQLLDYLVKKFGDPRFRQARWQTLAEDMKDANAAQLVMLVRGWLTERTVREFFDIIAATTTDPKQWAARQEFWLAYLDEGVIGDAWFAFGRQAEAMARSVIKEGQFGRIVGGGADANQSALVMAIKDLRVVEWSNNGSCRFWHKDDRKSPTLYKPEYIGTLFRDMNGSRGFEKYFAAIPHQSGWQSNFARFIFSHTGIRHPRWGEGYSTARWY